MSETTATPAVASPPSSPEPGPGLGATTPVVASESAAPAASSPEPAAPTEAAPATTEAKESLLSGLTADKPEGEEKPTEPEAPAEPTVETKPEEAPRPLPTFEKFTLPETVKVDDAQMGTFTGLLGEFENKIAADPTQAHAAAQEFGQKILDLYVAEATEASQRMAQLQRDNWDRVREDWLTEFRNDPDIGKNRQQTSLQRMGALMDMYGQSAGQERIDGLRSVLSLTGAGDNPEVLRFVNWAASRLTETARPVVPIIPRAPVVTSRAQRLYRNSTPGAA